MTSCLASLDSAALLCQDYQQICFVESKQIKQEVNPYTDAFS